MLICTVSELVCHNKYDLYSVHVLLYNLYSAVLVNTCVMQLCKHSCTLYSLKIFEGNRHEVLQHDKVQEKAQELVTVTGSWQG